MPYHSGTWGPEAQERSKRRLEYFHAYNHRKYQLHQNEILAKCEIYYELHREEILEKRAIAYSKTTLPISIYYGFRYILVSPNLAILNHQICPKRYILSIKVIFEGAFFRVRNGFFLQYLFTM